MDLDSASHQHRAVRKRKFEPELLGIDGLFRTAESTDPKLRNKAVQVWLESDALRMAALD